MTSVEIQTAVELLAATVTIIVMLKSSISKAKLELREHITNTMLEHLRLEHMKKGPDND